MSDTRSTRHTWQRQLILDAVRAHRDHPTAEQIYLDIRKIEPKISRATVYRNLKLLSETGEIRHTKVPGVDRFDLRTEPHYHLICTRCNAVYDVPLDYDASLDQTLEEKTGFRVLLHRTVFEGLCPDCAAKEGK